MQTRLSWHRITRAAFNNLQVQGGLVVGGRYDVLEPNGNLIQYIVGTNGLAFKESKAVTSAVTSYFTLQDVESSTFPDGAPEHILIENTLYERTAADPGHILSVETFDGHFYQIAAGSVTSFDALRHRREGQTDEDAISEAWSACYFDLGERHFIGMHDVQADLDYDVLEGAFTDDEQADRDYFDFNVQAGKGFKTDEDISFYNEHVQGIRNAHGYHKIRNYASACEVHRVGTYLLRLTNQGLLDYFGYEEDRGFGSLSAVTGNGQIRKRMDQIAVAPHPTRGAGFHSVTITILPTDTDFDLSVVVPGMCVDLGENLTSNPDRMANIVTALGGAALITGVTPRTLTFDYWDASGRGGFVGTSDIINTGTAGEIDRPSGEIRINNFQWRIRFNGNDRQQESSPGNQFGSSAFESIFSYVDHQDYNMIRFGVPSDPETKGRFVGNMSNYRGELMHWCGFSGRLVRLAINVDAVINNCAFGGIGVDHTAFGDRGVDSQLIGRLFCVRSTFSQLEGYGVLVSAFSAASMQSCNITNCSQGIGAITGGQLDFSASIVQRCVTGGRLLEGALMVINSITKFYNNGTGLNVFNQDQMVGAITPIFVDNDINFQGPSGALVKGGRVTGSTLAFQPSGVTLAAPATGVYEIAFASARSSQDFTVSIALRDLGYWEWDYIGLTGFRVRTYDTTGTPTNINFNFSYTSFE